MRRTRVLILIDWIWPAYRAGGPVRSIRNLVDKLSRRFEFLILAGDRDLGDEIPFQDVHLGRWIDEDVCRVMYLPRAEQGLFKLYDIINEVRPDVLYVNGIFSRFFSFYNKAECAAGCSSGDDSESIIEEMEEETLLDALSAPSPEVRECSLACDG